MQRDRVPGAGRPVRGDADQGGDQGPRAPGRLRARSPAGGDPPRDEDVGPVGAPEAGGGGRCAPAAAGAADAAGHQAALLQRPDRRPEAAVRGGVGARPFLRRQRALPLPGERLHAAGGRRRGLVLVTGPTGSGKSTTLAAMLDKINNERQEHIITIEDPIEYLHPHKKCLVNQREVNADTQGFKKALKYILRQDPDIVLIGEMRDLETIEAALTVAETGHLLFATLHTNSCVQTINRILDVFPPYQQPQVRAQLSFVLEGVISQILIPKASGNGRVLALEVMIPNPAIRNLIREEKVHQIYSQMQVGQAKFGMQTMNQSLLATYLRREITLDDAVGRSSDPDEFRNLLTAAQSHPQGAGRRP